MLLHFILWRCQQFLSEQYHETRYTCLIIYYLNLFSGSGSAIDLTGPGDVDLVCVKGPPSNICVQPGIENGGCGLSGLSRLNICNIFGKNCNFCIFDDNKTTETMQVYDSLNKWCKKNGGKLVKSASGTEETYPRC